MGELESSRYRDRPQRCVSVVDSFKNAAKPTQFDAGSWPRPTQIVFPKTPPADTRCGDLPFRPGRSWCGRAGNT